MSEVNSDQPLGAVVPNWAPPPAPPSDLMMEGTYAYLEPLSADRHAALLYRSYEGADRVWSYLPYGPFSSSALYHRWVRDVAGKPDPFFFVIQNKETRAFEGVASYLRVDPNAGSIEVGHINLSPALQHTRAATETMFLMMSWAFDAGYRRFEWKCDALNRSSRAAAQRLGLSYEGIFRQATVVKGRNRDTAWFATVDQEWPALREAFRVWLSPDNFTPDGKQIESLSDLTRLVRVSDDPAL